MCRSNVLCKPDYRGPKCRKRTGRGSRKRIVGVTATFPCTYGMRCCRLTPSCSHISEFFTILFKEWRSTFVHIVSRSRSVNANKRYDRDTHDHDLQQIVVDVRRTNECMSCLVSGWPRQASNIQGPTHGSIANST